MRINDIIDDIAQQKYKSYSKQDFIKDCCNIIQLLDWSNDPRTWPKLTLFYLIDIKLSKGYPALREEIQRMRMEK